MDKYLEFRSRLGWALRFESKSRKGNCFIRGVPRRAIAWHRGNKKGWISNIKKALALPNQDRKPL